MPLRAVLDSDGLIKLAKAGLLEPVLRAWECLVPSAVYTETVERGVAAAFPDALVIRQVLPRGAVRPPARHPRATALLERAQGLGRGEQAALHLFFAASADAVVTDDTAFLGLLERAGLRYLPPALVAVQLARQRHLEARAALEGLERMRPLIRSGVYRAARNDLESLGPRRRRTVEGASE